MPKAYEITTGLWARFDRYELVNGNIRPASGARYSQYDPWAHWRDGRDSEKPPPYYRLAKLVKDFCYGPGFVPLEDSIAEVLRWCAEYGLLGSLLHETFQVTLGAQWFQNTLFHQLRGIPKGTRLPMVVRYSRTNGEWAETIGGAETIRYLAERPRRQHLSDQHTLPAGWPAPGVLRQDPRSGEWQRSSFDDNWGRFFPDVVPARRETYPYPRPLSEEFWREYAEPLEAFLDRGMQIHDVMRGLSGSVDGSETIAQPRATISGKRKPAAGPAKQRTTPDQDGERAVWAAEARNILPGLLASVNPTFRSFAPREHSRGWTAGSLLGALAMMFLEDLTVGRRTIRCVVCGTPFVTVRPATKYCNRRCRSTAQKRSARRRKRQNTTKRVRRR